MRMLSQLLLVCGVAIVATVFPALAQQGQQQMPMTGGMMGQGSPGMMGQGQGGMMGQGAGGMMGDGMGGMMGGCPMSDMMASGRHGMMKGMGHGMMMHSVPMMEGRLAYIKADLEITDAQMPAWDAYAEAVRARHTTMESMHADMMKAKESGSALERMDVRIRAMESMVGSLKALRPSTEALYAVLTDEQKKKADQLLGGRCGMM